MSDPVQAISAVEDKYGLVVFRMALTHLVDVGVRHLSDNEAVAEDLGQILAKGKGNENNGISSVMSPEFQCAIVRCAAELARFSVWTLFAYIKKHVVITN